eukprot:5244419-Ditylum_brightwellii.AAC.1
MERFLSVHCACLEKHIISSGEIKKARLQFKKKMRQNPGMTLSGDKMLKSKQAYERVAAKHGVIIKKYHSDNGRFGKRTF